MFSIYQVSLRLKGQHYCAGALITPKSILTAAHCVCNRDVVFPEKILNFVSENENI